MCKDKPDCRNQANGCVIRVAGVVSEPVGGPVLAARGRHRHWAVGGTVPEA